MQQIHRPLTCDQKEALTLLCEEIGGRLKPGFADAARPSAAEGRLLASFFLKITSSSERAIILKLAEALAGQAEPS